MVRQRAGQLEPAALHEEVDDGEVEPHPAGSGQGLSSGAAYLHPISLALQEAGQVAAPARIAVDQEHERL
jgi:hypothetical protein